MSKKTKYLDEPIKAEVTEDFLPTPEELAAVERAWLDEIQRRSGDFDAGRMESIPAEEVFERARLRLKK